MPMRRAKIVATLGPATSNAAVLEKLLDLGVDVARINFSHSGHEEHARRLGWRDVGWRHPESWLRTLGFGIAIGASAEILGYTVVNPMLLRLTGEAATANGLAFLQGNLPAFLVLLAFTWPLAAVVEEMVYRGYVLNRLADLFGQSRLGWGISLMLSAVMFSLAHGQYGPRFIVTSSLMGLIEGGSYLLNRRNLWLPIIVHGMSNTISLTLLFLGL